MSRRKLSTVLAALVAAVMIGIRDSTGLAPPPPIFVAEEVHWLSPELDDELDGMVTIAESAEHHEVRTRPLGVSASRRSIRALLSRMIRRRD